MSVAYQQQELRLTRKEMAAQRHEMQEQRAQFERTAKAQEALAAAQERQAQAQEDSNRLALMAEYGRSRATVAQLYAARATIFSVPEVSFGPETEALEHDIGVRLKHEMEMIEVITALSRAKGPLSNMPPPPRARHHEHDRPTIHQRRARIPPQCAAHAELDLRAAVDDFLTSPTRENAFLLVTRRRTHQRTKTARPSDFWHQ